MRKATESERKSLYYWCKKHGKYGKLLMEEWGGYNSRANKIEITEIDFKSNEKVLWKCKNKHVWYESVARRVVFGTECEKCKAENEKNKKPKKQYKTKKHKVEKEPKARQIEKKPKEPKTVRKKSAHGTSYPEQFIFNALKQVYPDAENRCVVLKSEDNPHGFEFDIAIPSIPLCIEYSPTHWHKEKIPRDINKIELCKKHNVRIIYIQEDSRNELEHKMGTNYFCFHSTKKNQNDSLKEIVSKILESLGHTSDEVDFEKAKIEAMNIMQHGCIKKSLGHISEKVNFEKVKSEATASMSKGSNYYSEHPFENMQ